jgi:GNAT superfamily N-acetyltransferase
MAIAYTIESEVAAAEMAAVFAASGIRRPVDDLDRIARMIANADVIACARDNSKLVGVARALADFSYCCYLSDLAVDRAYQRKGIGKRLIDLVAERIGEDSMLLLLSAPEAHAYYPHIGFDKADNAWIIARRR